MISKNDGKLSHSPLFPNLKDKGKSERTINLSIWSNSPPKMFNHFQRWQRICILRIQDIVMKAYIYIYIKDKWEPNILEIKKLKTWDWYLTCKMQNQKNKIHASYDLLYYFQMIIVLFSNDYFKQFKRFNKTIIFKLYKAATES